MKKFTKNRTYLKYISLCVLVIFLVVSAVYVVLQKEIRSKFEDMSTETSYDNITHLAKFLDEQFYSMYHLDKLLSESSAVINSKYNNHPFYDYDIQTELTALRNTTSFISDILYVDTQKDLVYSSKYQYSYANEILTLYFSQDEVFEISFKDIPQDSNSFFKIDTTDETLLFFIPEQGSDIYQSLFLLNLTEFSVIMETMTSFAFSQIRIFDSNDILIFGTDNQNTTNINTSDLSPVECEYTKIKIYNIYDDTLFDTYIADTFKNTYILLLVILLFVVILLLFFAYKTYAPIKTFTNILEELNIDSQEDDIEYDLKYAGKIITSIKAQNDNLSEKIENYKISMQKSLLASKVPPTKYYTGAIDNIDTLFHSDKTIKIFIIRFALNTPVDAELFIKSMNSKLPKDLVIIPLNLSERGLTYLIGCETNFSLDTKLIRVSLDSLCNIYSCSYATSRYSENPIEIPRLFEELMIATHTQDVKVVNPVFETLDKFKCLLDEKNYSKATEVIQVLFETLDVFIEINFMVQAVLIDALMILVTNLNKNNVTFEMYDAIYSKTLLQCRSKNFANERDSILNSMISLIATLQDTEQYPELTKDSFEKFVADRYYDSALSLKYVGEHFDATGTYISYWFKKNFEENFSEYLWLLRFNKSVELMLDSDMNMVEISEKVGYDNYTSFRRKFKNYTGVSPSEYRESHINQA